MHLFRGMPLRLLPVGLVALGMVWPALPARGAEANPLTLEVAGVRLELSSRGGFAIQRDKSQLIRGARLVLAGEGWKRSVSQDALQRSDGYPRQEGGAWLFRGTLLEPVSQVTWTLEQRVAPVAGAVRVDYTATPERDCALAEACVFLDLPVAEWSNQPVLLWPSDEGVFPASPPPERHFLSGVARHLALGAPGPGRLGLAFEAAALCTVQDGREFGGDCYQIYPRLRCERLIKAGTPCRLSLQIIPGDTTALPLANLALDSHGEPALKDIAPGPGQVPQFTRWEAAFHATGQWTNPFDPDQVAIDAVIQTPAKQEIVVPAFFFQDYQRDDIGGMELLLPTGNPGWRVRFAPVTPGEHRWQLRMRHAGRVITSPEMTFTCTPAPAHHGYLRVARTNPRYFEFDDGTPFTGIGMNIATLDAARLVSADRWYERFAAVGGNLVRSWWCASGTDVESATGKRADQQLGRYRQEDCWRIDHLVTTCERLGLHLMACIETQQALRRDAWWGSFNYNRANGGPLDAPADFFTNADAQRLFRNRLRYLVARWSYSPAIFSWQFWNEVSACNDFRPEPVAAWHREMAAYLRGIDPARHLIHTNFGNLDGYREIDGLPGMEVISSNIYSRRDMAQTGIWGTRYLTSHYAKPFLLTEYGVGHHGGWIPEDPTGIIVHNGLWGPLLSGSAGTGMPWGWGNWIDTLDLYHYWKPAADLAREVPFAKRQWRPLQVASFRFRHGDAAPAYASVFLEGWPRNYNYTLCPAQRPEVYQIDAEGESPQEESLSAVLRSQERCTLEATFPVDGALVVHVPEISESGKPVLEVAIDGKPALTQPLERGDGLPWAYWQKFAVPVTAGRHRLTIANPGSGSFWTAYELENFRRREGPDLEVAGQSCEDFILVWLRNPRFIWLCQREGLAPAPQAEGWLTLHGIADGTYDATWIETTTGAALAPGTAQASGGCLKLPTPGVTRSAVAKLIRRPARG